MARRLPLLLALMAWTNAALAADPSAGDAPFGLTWGPMDRVERPSMVDREANLTGLFYFHDRPLAAGQDTFEVVLVVCREQGLQQVVWIGRPLDEASTVVAREAIRRAGENRYGEPRPGPLPGSLEWPAARTVLATRAGPNGTRELVMTTSGPDFSACSNSHRVATGHPAEAHVADLLGAAAP